MAEGTPADDPLRIDPLWPSPVPLQGFEEALEHTLFRSGLSREAWLRRLATDLHRQALLPLLWLLPKGWRLAPAQLPPRLHTLAGVLERGLLTPGLLAALADDLPHLLPGAQGHRRGPLELWQQQQHLPRALQDLLAHCSEEPASRDAAPSEAGRSTAMTRTSQLSGGLVWRNVGLEHDQSAGARRCNSAVARVLNRLGANLLGGKPYQIDGCSSSSGWLTQLQDRGWQARAQVRSSVASFGLGASLCDDAGQWIQIPLGLPIRSGLLAENGLELQTLLPHSCLELELQSPCDQQPITLRLQFYQGTEGLCGWEGLNDLPRPWQNDRRNGTVRYLGEPYQGERLDQVLQLCDVMAWIHNLEGNQRHLLHGGYGTLGFCIDTSALLQQAMEGRCSLFPVLLGGIWRERLLLRCRQLQERGSAEAGEHRQALELYRQGLDALPIDLGLHGATAEAGTQRLLACRPSNTPFVLLQHPETAATT
jgi:hypothetical protein